MNFVIITPAHNEGEFVRYTLDSVLAQSVRPVEWVIVDDGSTDDTAEIIQAYAERQPWIKLVRNSQDNAGHKGGGKVVRAFNRGYQALGTGDFDVVAKLDADLTVPPNYFEELGKSFASNPTIGMCGGLLVVRSKGTWKVERTASYHLRGAIKAYRKKCFEQIGGLRPVSNWDFLDEMSAMYLGWIVKILPLEVKHHRPTSDRLNRGLRFSYNMGRVYYRDGYDFILSSLSSVRYGLYTKPYLLSSAALMSGFCWSWLTKPEKEVDPGLQEFIRKFQYDRIRRYFRIIGAAGSG